MVITLSRKVVKITYEDAPTMKTSIRICSPKVLNFTFRKSFLSRFQIDALSALFHEPEFSIDETSVLYFSSTVKRLYSELVVGYLENLTVFEAISSFGKLIVNMLSPPFVRG